MVHPSPAFDHLRMLFAAAIAAVDPRFLIHRVVRKEQGDLVITPPGASLPRYRFPLTGRLLLIGAGKGAGVLAHGLAQVCAEQEIHGTVVVPVGQPLAIPQVAVLHGEHPLPGAGSVRGADAIFALLAQKQPHDLICFCLTGGASSLLVSPAEGISLADKVVVNQLLLACGADIREVNSVRKHLSRIKGGALARAAFPNHIVSFILSDVPNDELSTIGSGPTVPDPSTFAEVWEIVTRYGLRERLPASVRTHLEAGCQGRQPETPKPGDPIFSRTHHILVGSSRLALDAAAAAARNLRYVPHQMPTLLAGDTTETAHSFAQTLRSIVQTCQAPTCVLAGGETTVRVTGHGKGGRNQEFALVVAEALQEEHNWVLLSAGTDGVDGPTDAAGAFADGTSITRARAKGLDAPQMLGENDSYAFFAALGDLFRPGPTGTNVMDIKIALVWPSAGKEKNASV